MLPSDGTILSGGDITRSKSPKLCQAVEPSKLSDGTTELQAVVPPNTSGDTASTSEIEDETLFCFIFEAIGVYKYPTLSYMKEYKMCEQKS